jgi:hypothetical protein
MQVPSLALELSSPTCRVDAVGIADEEQAQATPLLDRTFQREFLAQVLMLSSALDPTAIESSVSFRKADYPSSGSTNALTSAHRIPGRLEKTVI